jgi:hypothetical protein
MIGLEMRQLWRSLSRGRAGVERLGRLGDRRPGAREFTVVVHRTRLGNAVHTGRLPHGKRSASARSTAPRVTHTSGGTRNNHHGSPTVLAGGSVKRAR